MEGLTDEANVKLEVDGNSFLTKCLIKDCISVKVDHICDISNCILHIFLHNGLSFSA